MIAAVHEDEWRVEVDLDDEGNGYSLTERLRSVDLDEDARQRLGDRVIVTRDGSQLFLYTMTAAEAREAETVIRQLLEHESLEANVAVTRWHPLEETWQDASIPLPATPAERDREVERLEEAEAREAREEGSYDWHVRVHLPSRHDAVELERRLRAEALPVHRRWRYVTIGALTEERGNELAARLADELPEDAEVWVEAHDVRMPLFVFFG